MQGRKIESNSMKPDSTHLIPNPSTSKQLVASIFSVDLSIFVLKKNIDMHINSK